MFPRSIAHDLDYLIEMIDWEANVDPNFSANRLFDPHPVRADRRDGQAGYSESWVVYSTPHYSAKELTVFPGKSVTIKDSAAHGVIVVQGYGTFGKHETETPTLIRFGQMTKDEFFVSADRAKEGVVITNKSDRENLVMLKHFRAGESGRSYRQTCGCLSEGKLGYPRSMKSMSSRG